jgi:hypothetical protein
LREVYIVATEQTEALAPAVLAEAFPGDDAALELAEDGSGFRLRSAESTVTVRFEALEAAIGWTPELLTGSDAAHALFRRARGFYRIAFEPGVPGPAAAVFEALWCARALLERLPGVLLDVTAFKLHEVEDVAEITELDFDIRDHVNLHAVEVAEGDAPYWVHSHGMEKFGTRELEVFRLAEDDLRAAESFVHELCADLAWGEGPRLRERVETSNGEAFMLAPSEEARITLIGLPMDTFEGHEGASFTVVSADGRHTLAELLRPYRTRFEKEAPERTEALEQQARELLPAFKARFHRRGLMEPITFLIRASFEVHPESESEAVKEDLWLEVLTWEDAQLVGKLVDGAVHTTEWRKGAAVEVEESHINAVAVGRDARALDEEEMQSFLLTERPM